MELWICVSEFAGLFCGRAERRWETTFSRAVRLIRPARLNENPANTANHLQVFAQEVDTDGFQAGAKEAHSDFRRSERAL